MLIIYLINIMIVISRKEVIIQEVVLPPTQQFIDNPDSLDADHQKED